MRIRRRPLHPLLPTVIGPAAYLALGLFALPRVADISSRLAIVALMAFTGAYCYLIARRRGLPAPLWAVAGLGTAFFELGLIPVLLVGLLRARTAKDGVPPV